MHVVQIDELEIDPALDARIVALLRASFPDVALDRRYYKLPPRFRLLALDGEVLAGHVGVDARVVGTEEGPVRVFGVVDLCVARSHRSRGLGADLLARVEALARQARADFVVLFADDHRVYLRNGFVRAENLCRWTMIHEHRTLGVKEAPLDDCLMVKAVGARAWPSGTVDLLGHVF
jgi:predicted N-acetyltransferase YhbS